MLFQTNAQRLPLASASVDLILTDPPYHREYLPCYHWLATEAKRVLKPGSFVLALCGGLYLNRIFYLFDEAGLSFYWKYEMHMPGPETSRVWPRGRRHPQVSIDVKSKSILAYSNGCSQPWTCTTSLIEGGRRDKRYHRWGQDMASAEYCIGAFSQPGDVVLDPFVGGGTTAVVCRNMQRRWICADIDPQALTTTAKRLACT